tara:strand:+ start:916 stop:1353 length:438 start_codon:yes stop_codon:yes gene_type:complete
MKPQDKPYVLYVAEVIYLEISEIKKKNLNLSNTEAINIFIGTKTYNEISSGKFHENWFKELKKNNFVDKTNNKKISEETIELLKIQKNFIIKNLIKFPDLYDAKSFTQLKISQRAFDHLWRMCESYELWCKESKQIKLISLNITN